MKIWGYVVLAMTFVGGILKFWTAGKKAGANEAKIIVTKSALRQRDKANKALVDGLTKESEIRNEKVDTDKRDHFTKQ